MKKICLLIFVLFIQSALFMHGQSTYYSTDSVTFYGVNLIDGGRLNYHFCQVKDGDEILRYSAKEVTEFGFIDGRVFVSKEIQMNDTVLFVFVERLIKGETSLYHFRDRGTNKYFAETTGSSNRELIEIEKEFLDNILYDLSQSCSDAEPAVQLVRYQKKSLSRFFQSYNACDFNYFPKLRYGLSIAYEFVNLLPVPNAENNLQHFDLIYDGSYTIGAFLDYPINVSEFSLNVALHYAKHGFSYNATDSEKDIFFVANTSGLSLPLLVRYTLPFSQKRPFFNLGGLFIHHFKNDSYILEAERLNQTVTITEMNTRSLVSNNYLGVAIGAGIEFRVASLISLFTEVRYNRLTSNQRDCMDISSFNFVTSVSF